MRDHNHNHKRRNRFRSNGRHFRRNGAFNNHSSGASLGNFSRSRGNQSASKLLEKYTNLAKEALSSGDKILSENYFQHVEHFSRILADRNSEISSKPSTEKIADKETNQTEENLEKNKAVTDSR